MRVRIDHEFDALLFRQRTPTPVEIESLWRGVELDPGASRGRGLEHRRNVDQIRIALQEEPPGQMAENGDERIFHCANDSLGHLRFRESENGVNRGYRQVRLRQGLD